MTNKHPSETTASREDLLRLLSEKQALLDEMAAALEVGLIWHEMATHKAQPKCWENRVKKALANYNASKGE